MLSQVIYCEHVICIKTLYCLLLHIHILNINIITAICLHVTVNCGSPHAAAAERRRNIAGAGAKLNILISD